MSLILARIRGLFLWERCEKNKSKSTKHGQFPEIGKNPFTIAFPRKSFELRNLHIVKALVKSFKRNRNNLKGGILLKC